MRTSLLFQFKSLLHHHYSYCTTVSNTTKTKTKKDFRLTTNYLNDVLNKQLFGPPVKTRSKKKKLKIIAQKNLNDEEFPMNPSQLEEETPNQSEKELYNLFGEEIHISNLKKYPSDDEDENSENVTDLNLEELFSKAGDFISHPNKMDDIKKENPAIIQEEMEIHPVNSSSTFLDTMYFESPEKTTIDVTTLNSPYLIKTRKKVPSVTTIIKDTMPAESQIRLFFWEQKMIRELGLEGFSDYKTKTFRYGSILHKYIENVFLNNFGNIEEEISDERSQNHIKSLGSVLGNEISNPVILESYIHHEKLGFGGIADCVAFYKGELTVIDWKTSERKKNKLRDTYENPLQIAAYAGALNFDSNYPFLVSRGLIVVAYNDGSPASLIEISPDAMKYYWNQWNIRLEIYKQIKEILN